MATNSKPPRENLYRALIADGAAEYRDDGETGPVLTGHAAVFNTWTEINSAFEGRFMERLAPGAFTKTIAENRDRIRVLFQHGRDPQIGDKPLGPLRTLEEDATGLRYEVDLLPTSYNADLEPGLRAGLYGASFRFSTVREDFVNRPTRSEHNPNGIPERTLQEVRLMELGPVTFGAYPEATSGVRSLTDEILRSQLAIAEPEKKNTFTVSFNGTQIDVPNLAERTDQEAVDVLSQMVDLGTQFIGMEADDPDDAADQEAMNKILAQINALIVEEQNEPDDGAGDSMNEAPRAETPEPSEATTSVEPEPYGATTRSDQEPDAYVFRFVKDPRKGAKTK